MTPQPQMQGTPGQQRKQADGQVFGKNQNHFNDVMPNQFN
jgi:hypothetical protein